MPRRLMQAAVVLVVALVAAQFVRPRLSNPPTDRSQAIQAHVSSELGAILQRSCGDCHSNRTEWPGFTKVAPLSWAYAYSVTQGRKVLNFSQWTMYPPERQRQLLEASCQAVTAGKMPGVWASLHPESRLSSRDAETICAAAHSLVLH